MFIKEKLRMLIAFLALAAIAIIATIMALVKRKAWWIRVFDFPRLQIMIVMIISITGLLFYAPIFEWYHYAVLGLTLVGLIIQVKYVYPYFAFAKKDLQDCTDVEGERISFMVSNVLQKNNEYDKLLERVREVDPDIFLGVETSKEWVDNLGKLEDKYEFSVKKPLENTYGMILFSKYPLENARIEYIIKEEIPSIHADVLFPGLKFKLACLHPEPPAPDEAEMTKPRDRELVAMARKIRENPAPYVVMGDLNDVAWSDTSYIFERISKLSDPRKGRGFFNTFHAKNPLLRWSLDHIFLSRDFKLKKIKTLPTVGSDHFPIYLDCCITALNKGR